MKKYYNVLRNCELFKNITDENLIPLLSCLGAAVYSFDKKMHIISEGEETGSIGIVLSGEAQIEQSDFFGNRSTVSKNLPSEVFGEAFSFADIPAMPVDVIATEKTEVMFIDSKRITHPCCNACSFHQQIIFNMMKILAAKNIQYHQKIEITSKRSTREKLLTFLKAQAKRYSSNCFIIPFDRQELVDYLQVDRSGLSAEISKLRAEGIIESERSSFRLLREAEM